MTDNKCRIDITLEWNWNGLQKGFNWIFNAFFLWWVGKYVYYIIMYEFHDFKKCFKPNIEEME